MSKNKFSVVPQERSRAVLGQTVRLDYHPASCTCRPCRRIRWKALKRSAAKAQS